MTGLGLLADGLRKPIAVEKPLLGPNDWHRIAFGVYRSSRLASAIRALGAEPSEVIGPRRDQALEQDEIQGFEMGLLRYRLGNLWRQAPYVTANVNLWPQMFAIIGNPDSLASLATSSVTR